MLLARVRCTPRKSLTAFTFGRPRRSSRSGVERSWAALKAVRAALSCVPVTLSLGVVDDMWFQWITDFGLPGPDRGEGGKYLFVLPAYTGELPGGGYFVQKMRTTRATMLGRSFLEKNDPKPVVALIKKTLKIYPYLPGGYGTSIGSALRGQGDVGAHAGSQTGLGLSATRGAGEVHRRQRQGDEHGAAKRLQLLRDAQRCGAEGARRRARPGDHGVAGRHRHREGQAVQSRCADETDPDGRGRDRNRGGADLELEMPPVGRRLLLPQLSLVQPALHLGGYNFETPPPQVSPDGVITPYPPTGARTLNIRTAFFFAYTFITPAMIMRLTDIGSQYIIDFVDTKGEYFDGSKTYKVTLPPNIPAGKFWSFTVYDNQTRSMLDTPQRYPRAGSQSYPTPAADASTDGSTTVYFSPTKPDGVNAGNWIQTDPKKGWFTILRLYSPLEPFFTKDMAAERDRGGEVIRSRNARAAHSLRCGRAFTIERHP